MRLFLLNILLAMAWAAASGTFSLGTLSAGFAVGYVVLLLVRPVLGPSAYHAKLWQALAFAARYLWALLLASVRVAYDVLTPRFRMNPGVVGIPLDARTDLEILVLANLLSLTPGTLSLDVSPDRRTLFIHAMYIDGGDVEALRADVKSDLERRVLRLLRSESPGQAPRAEGPKGPTWRGFRRS